MKDMPIGCRRDFNTPQESQVRLMGQRLRYLNRRNRIVVSDGKEPHAQRLQTLYDLGGRPTTIRSGRVNMQIDARYVPIS
jgi:hypothetical protein